MPPYEREIVRRTRELLTSAGSKVVKTSGQGEPDLIGSYQGFAFAIECKTEGNSPTRLQVARLTEWRRAGAIAFWTDFPADALKQVQDGAALRIIALRHIVETERHGPETRANDD